MNLFETPQLTVEELSTALYNANEKLRLLNEELTESNNVLSCTNQALEKSNNELKNSDRIRSEMFANISHDLRSPITAIKSTIEYLLSTKETPYNELCSMLNSMIHRVNVLENFIDDIFLLASLESNVVPMKFEKLDIIPILEEFYCECTVDTKYSNRSLLLDIQENGPCIVNIDAKNFIRVLDNLFNNALKYSKKSGDKIELRLLIKDSNVIIMVEDTGIGIKADQVSKIFLRCYMADSARTPNRKQGFGLGLSIAKSIIEQHNGSISCNSTYGKGSRFIITLPKY